MADNKSIHWNENSSEAIYLIGKFDWKTIMVWIANYDTGSDSSCFKMTDLPVMYEPAGYLKSSTTTFIPVV